jgi:hypothetical protein
MDKNNKSEYFDLLLLNDPSEMLEFLLSKGKRPKVICPIIFLKGDASENEDQ